MPTQPLGLCFDIAPVSGAEVPDTGLGAVFIFKTRGSYGPLAISPFLKNGEIAEGWFSDYRLKQITV